MIEHIGKKPPTEMHINLLDENTDKWIMKGDNLLKDKDLFDDLSAKHPDIFSFSPAELQESQYLN